MRKFKLSFIAGLCGVLAFMFLGQGCERSEKPKDVVAQVNNSILTLTRLKEQFPQEYAKLIKKEQYLDFIKRWMDEEILYQDALKKKMDEDPDVQEKILELSKKIVVEAYLKKEFMDIKYEPEEAAVNHYYQTHADNFVRSETEIKVASLVVESLKLAWEVRGLVTGENFIDLVQEYSIADKLQNFDGLRFQKENDLDSCIAESAFNTRIGGTTTPIKCEDGYHLVRVVDKQNPGTTRALEDVREEIEHHLIQIWRKRNLEEKIDELKKEIYFSSNLDLLPNAPDSTNE